MNRARVLHAVLVSALASSACNFGPAAFRVGEIRIEYTNGGNTDVEIIEISYADDGRVEEIERTRGSDLVSRHEYNYEDGRLVEIEVTSGGDVYDLEVTWENGTITAMEGQGDARHEYELSYLDDTSLLEEHSYTASADGYSYTSTTQFECDDQNRWVEANGTVDFDFPFGGSSSTLTQYELEWGDDGKPETFQVTTTTGGNTDSEEWEIGYGDDGKPEEADNGDGDDVELSYDDQGRLEEVVGRDGSSTTGYEYSYEDGNVADGFVFLPSGLFGIFDLAGNPVPRPHVYSTQFVPSY